MSEDVAGAYDEVAARYASLFLGDLDEDENARPWVDDFVDAVDPDGGPVVDLGCGPGHGVAHLAGRGLRAFGLDLSPGQIGQARLAFPDLDVRVGDLTALDLDAASIGGVFARYSIIPLRPGQLADTFAEWARVLDAGAPVLLFFFASRHPAHHGTPFDHKVAPAFELDPATVGGILGAADFEQIRIGASPLPPGGRPLDQGVVLARRSTR